MDLIAYGRLVHDFVVESFFIHSPFFPDSSVHILAGHPCIAEPHSLIIIS